MKPDPNNTEDQILLRKFVKTRDEAAFRGLVEKYTSLVFGVAMRRTGRRDAAEEIVQTVFLILARKAGCLGRQRSLGAWLHRTATFESLKSLRQDSTRTRHLDMIREHQEIQCADDEAFWKDVRPLLDQLLDRLSSNDREILVAHYFEGRQFAEIASRTGITAAAAQKRGARALKKLAALLAKRGVVIPAAVLASGLGAELTHAVPVGLATKVGTSVLGSTITSATTSAATTSIITAMTTSKIAFAATFVIAASIPVGVHWTTSAAADKRGATAQQPAAIGQGIERTKPRSKWAFSAEKFREDLVLLTAADSGADASVERWQKRLFGLDLEEIRTAIAVLDEFEKPDRLYDLMQTAYARWAELDPAAAVADAGNRPKSPWGFYPIQGAWQTWAFADWDSARAWARDNQTEYDSSWFYWKYLDTMGAIDGKLTVERSLLLGEDKPDLKDQVLGRALKAWIKQQPEETISWMRENLDDPVQRDLVAGKALEALGERHPITALDEVDLLENLERRREVRYNIFWSWSLQRPDAAADYVEGNRGEGWSESTLRSAGEAIARNDPARAIEVARSITDAEGRDSFYVGILGGARESDFSQVIEAADHLSPSGARTNGSLRYFLEDWASSDREAARQWVEALPPGQKKQDARHLFPRD